MAGGHSVAEVELIVFADKLTYPLTYSLTYPLTTSYESEAYT